MKEYTLKIVLISSDIHISHAFYMSFRDENEQLHPPKHHFN